MNDSPDPGVEVADPTEPAVRSWIAPPNDVPMPAIKLWTPRGIGVTSVLLGFPGAVVLAALN
jgi:hypothetical protein